MLINKLLYRQKLHVCLRFFVINVVYRFTTIPLIIYLGVGETLDKFGNSANQSHALISHIFVRMVRNTLFFFNPMPISNQTERKFEIIKHMILFITFSVTY